MLKLNKGVIVMARPSGTKNIMRTLEEKEKVVLEYLNSKEGYRRIAENNDIYPGVLLKWIKLYREKGIVGLKPKTGKNGKGKGNFKKLRLKN
jgi:transposase-like protein